MAQFSKKPINLCIAMLLLCGIAYSCSKKAEEESESEVPAENPTEVPSPPTSAPGPETSSNGDVVIADDLLDIKITGFPKRYSQAGTMNLKFTSSRSFKIKFAILNAETGCQNAGYSEWLASPAEIPIDVGEDGNKIVCLFALGTNAAGAIQPASWSYSWTKDTLAPSLGLILPTVSGPYSDENAEITLRGVARDSLSQVASVALSFSSPTGGCLDDSWTNFSAACPHFFATSGRDEFHVNVPKAALLQSGDYCVTATATDYAGNPTSPAPQCMTWVAVPPPNPLGFSVWQFNAAVVANWQTPASPATYLLVRSSQGPVTFLPVPGRSYAAGQVVAAGEKIIYFGANTSMTDSSVEPRALYDYALFAIDAQHNVSAAVTAHILTSDPTSFSGAYEAVRASTSPLFKLHWQMVQTDQTGATGNTSVNYTVFSASILDQLFAGTGLPAGVDVAEAIVPLAGSKGYAGVRAQASDFNTDSNKAAALLANTKGSLIALAGQGRFFNTSLATYLGTPQAVAFTPAGNLIFAARAGMVHVICHSLAEFVCQGRLLGQMYTLAGQDAVGDGFSDEPAAQSALGEIRAITVNRWGNIILADATYNRVRVICEDNVRADICFLRKRGNIFNVAGNGVSGETTEGSPLITSFKTLVGVAVDSASNILIADGGAGRIHALCTNTEGAFCTGKVAGNLVFAAGSSVADGPNGGLILASGLGGITAFTVAAGDNLYIADSTNYRIRVVCAATDSTFCADANKKGKIWYVTGDGSASVPSPSGSPFANLGAGTPSALAMDSAGNLLAADTLYPDYRLHVYCFTTQGFCTNAAVGKVYDLAGVSGFGDGSDAVAWLSASLGRPAAMAIDAHDTLVVADALKNRLRLLCANVTSEICKSRAANMHYRYAGALTTALTSGTAAPASPIGTAFGLARDPWNNLYWGDADNAKISVYCSTVNQAGFCKDKPLGSVHNLTTSGVATFVGPGTPIAPARMTLRQPQALTLDRYGNIFWADLENFVFGYCVADSGLCAGKSKTDLLFVAGRFQKDAGGNLLIPALANTEDGSGGSLPWQSPMGAVKGLAFDGDGNLYFADSYFYRLRILCVNRIGWFCGTKVQGTMYNLSGGAALPTAAPARGDAGNGVAVAQTMAGGVGYGKTSALAADPFGNIVIADQDYERIRMLCNTNSGFCAAPKQVGYVYRVLGNPSNMSDGPDSFDIADPGRVYRLGDLIGITTDMGGNLYAADVRYGRIRVVCIENVLPGVCKDRLTGLVYNVFGNGSVGSVDPASGSPATISLPKFSTGGITMTTDGILVFSTKETGSGLLYAIPTQ